MELLDGLLLAVFMGKPVWMWCVFMAIVLALLVFDLGVLHRKAHEIEVKESLMLSAGYITAGVAYGGWVWWYLGATSGMQYLTGFVVEKTLAMDNVFIIAMIFSFFAIPRLHQHRVLFWGILGVIVLRALMIGLGAPLVENFEWLLYVLALFLMVTGARMLVMGDKEPDFSRNRLLLFLKRHFRITDTLHGEAFFVKKRHPATGKMVRYMTPLMLALLMIEVADVVFAVDSVPAIFLITTDPFLVYTSNIFAILGLRALYFALAAMVHRFAYLSYALSVLLIFIGSKIFVAWAMGWEKFPPMWSLGLTLLILMSGVGFSLWKTRPAAKAA